LFNLVRLNSPNEGSVLGLTEKTVENDQSMIKKAPKKSVFAV